MAGTGWPSGVTFSAFTDGRTCSATATPRMAIMTEALGEFLLSKLLWLMKTNDQLFRPQDKAVHGVQCGSSYLCCSTKVRTR